jgi:hypothetical protein
MRCFRTATRLALSVLCAACLLSSTNAQQEVTVQQVDSIYTSMYPGITAANGLSIPLNGVEINVMYPPLPSINATKPTTHMCSFPQWLANVNETRKQALQQTDAHPICFVVGGEGKANCRLEQQVMITQQIHDKLNDHVKCLIVYGNSPDINNLNIKDYDVAVIYIPFLAGQDLLARMDQQVASTNATAFFFDTSGKNVKWRFAFVVQPYGDAGHYRQSAADNFFWFRIVLFTLLIVSPCLRAAYLWYAGGGRVHARRSENGRLIGFQVVP